MVLVFWGGTKNCGKFLHFWTKLQAKRFGVQIQVRERPSSLLQNVPTGCGVHSVSYSTNAKVPSQGKSGRDVILTSHIYLAPRFRMTGAICLLPLQTLMAWTGTLPCLLFTLRIYPNIRRLCMNDTTLSLSSILGNYLYGTSVKHVRDFKGPAQFFTWYIRKYHTKCVCLSLPWVPLPSRRFLAGSRHSTE
jgi:hypothetical protein